MSVSQQVVLHLKGFFSQTGEESLYQRDAAQANSKQISVYNHLLNTRPPSRSPIVTFVSNENNFKNANGKKLPFFGKVLLFVTQAVASVGWQSVMPKILPKIGRTDFISRVLYLLPAPSFPPTEFLLDPLLDN